MAQILRSKNLASRFQILLEIAANQPNIQQKMIAAKLDITSQAVSEYIRELMKDGWVSSQGRSRYRVTQKGVDWILRMSRELQSYAWFVGKVVADISTSTAIADADLSAGQPVSLHMENGLLLASDVIKEGDATAQAVSRAGRGDDVGVSGIEGVIELRQAKLTVARVPNVRDGGSERVDLKRLTKLVDAAAVSGAIGVESVVAFRRIERKPGYTYGVREAAIEAAFRGVPFLVVCAEDRVPPLLDRLEQENLAYDLVDLKKAGRAAAR